LEPFFALKREPWTSKIIEINATVVKNQGFAIFSPDRFWTSIWDPPGLLLGGYLAPGNAETSLLGGLWPSKSRFQLLFWAPKASKSAPRGIQERPIRPWKPSSGLSSLFKSSKRPPRALQEASRAHVATILAPFWTNVEAISMRCCPHVGHVSSLKAPSPRALDPRPQAWRNARERSAAHLWWCWACFQNAAADSGLSRLK